MPPSPVESIPCACGCGRLVRQAQGRGRPRRYFEESCRWRARAQRRLSAGFRLMPRLPAQKVNREQLADVLAGLLDPDQERKPEEELTLTLLEVDSAAGRMVLLVPSLPSHTGALASVLAARIRDALLDTFPEAVAR